MAISNYTSIKAILTDAGSILYRTSALRKAIYLTILEIPEFSNLTLEQYKRDFTRFKEKAELHPEYTIDNAIIDFSAQYGLKEQALNLKKERGYIHADCAPKTSAQKSVMEYIANFGVKNFSNEKLDVYLKGRITKTELDTLKTKMDIVDSHVRTALSELKSMEIPIIVITDAYKTTAEMALDLYSIDILHYIQDIVSSKEVGVKKPHPKIFEEALKRNSLKPEEVVFIAHDIDELKGAHELGLRVIAYNFAPEEDLGFLDNNSKIISLKTFVRQLGAKK